MATQHTLYLLREQLYCTVRFVANDCKSYSVLSSSRSRAPIERAPDERIRHEKRGKTKPFPASNRRNEYRLFRAAIQFRAATGQYGADLRFPGRGRGHHAASVAGGSDDRPDRPAHRWRIERSYVEPFGASHSLFPDRCDPVFAGSVRHAVFAHIVGRGFAAVDPRCGQQYHDGTLSRLRFRPPRARPAARRVPHAKRLHRSRADAELSGADSADGVLREGRNRRERRSGDREGGFHHRSDPVDQHDRVVDLARAGIASERSGAGGPRRAPAIRLIRPFGHRYRHSRDAQADAPACLCNAVPMVCNVRVLAVHSLCDWSFALRYCRSPKRGLS